MATIKSLSLLSFVFAPVANTVAEGTKLRWVLVLGVTGDTVTGLSVTTNAQFGLVRLSLGPGNDKVAYVTRSITSFKIDDIVKKSERVLTLDESRALLEVLPFIEDALVPESTQVRRILEARIAKAARKLESKKL